MSLRLFLLKTASFITILSMLLSPFSPLMGSARAYTPRDDGAAQAVEGGECVVPTSSNC